MAAAALIKFTQGALVGTDGQALLGLLAASVTVTNVVNTGVLSWQVDVLDVPGGSAVAVGVLASNNNSATPSASFTPDQRGSYRIRLQVWDAINRVGTATDLDIRVFAVTEVNGLVAPPAQIWPRPLPPVASGELGNKADELNFLGQTRGFAGTGVDGLLEAALTLIDKINAASVDGKFFGGAAKGFVYPRPTSPVRGLRIFDHSYSDLQEGVTSTSITSNDYLWPHILAGALGIPKERVFNHSVSGTQLTFPNAGYGWVTALLALADIKPSVGPPVTRWGECSIIGYGINDLGNNTAANQTKIIADFGRCLKAIISMCRAGALFLCQASTQWSFGANLTNAAVAANDWTIGQAKQATVVDSAGSTTATFKIPAYYKGETICFHMTAMSGGSCIVTWGGTVTGTTGTTIVGRTDTLSNLTVQAQGSYPVRFTAAATGLSAANAGQTITVRLTTVSASTWYLDGAWFEAAKPSPVIVLNTPRLSEKTIDVEFGDLVLTNASTAATSPNLGANFLAASDNGQILQITDGSGGLQASTTVTVSSPTAITLSLAANANRTNAKAFIRRKRMGYSSNYGGGNSNFTGATAANHTAADNAVLALNTEKAARIAEFVAANGNCMVQMADIDAATGGGDVTPPVGQYSWFEEAGLHLNEYAQEPAAGAVLKAIYACAPEDANDLGALEISGGASRSFGPLIMPVRNNAVITTAYTAFGSYTCVVGDVFAQWIFISDPTAQLVSWFCEQTGATGTSIVRTALYSDVNGMGYPGVAIGDMGNFTMTASANAKTLATIANPLRSLKYGYYWIVFKVETLNVASVIRGASGPQTWGPLGGWQAAGGASAPVGWKLTGQAAGAFPNRFYPTGASMVTTVPLIGAVVNRF